MSDKFKLREDEESFKLKSSQNKLLIAEELLGNFCVVNCINLSLDFNELNKKYIHTSTIHILV